MASGGTRHCLKQPLRADYGANELSVLITGQGGGQVYERVYAVEGLDEISRRP